MSKAILIKCLKSLIEYLEDEQTSLDGLPDAQRLEIENDILDLGAGAGGYKVSALTGRRFYRINLQTFNPRHSDVAERSKELL